MRLVIIRYCSFCGVNFLELFVFYFRFTSDSKSPNARNHAASPHSGVGCSEDHKSTGPDSASNPRSSTIRTQPCNEHSRINPLKHSGERNESFCCSYPNYAIEFISRIAFLNRSGH